MKKISIEEAKNRLTPSGLKKGVKSNITIKYVKSMDKNNNILLFKRGNLYIFSPAYDELDPIIAELDGEISSKIPENLQDWIEVCAADMENGSVRKAKAVTNRRYISPLVTFKWNQGAPYNNKLPIDPVTKKRCLTGCNSTSIGMLLAYWGSKGFRRGCTKTEAYHSKFSTSEMDVPALPSIEVFDYPNLLETTDQINKSTDAKNAVGNLMKYIGYSIQSNYSSNGTNATIPNDVAHLMLNFRMGKNIKFIYSYYKTTIDKFKLQIYDELDKGCPVLVAGTNESNIGGHIFICDGYNPDTDRFHFNWGWGGKYDGWFDINSLVPATNKDYSYYKVAIVGIFPEYKLGDINGDKTITVTDVMMVNKAIMENKFDEKFDVNSDGVVDKEDSYLLIDVILGKKRL